jgi:hypothetical protein
MLVAEHGGPTMMARIGMMKAIHRGKGEAMRGPRKRRQRSIGQSVDLAEDDDRFRNTVLRLDYFAKMGDCHRPMLWYGSRPFPYAIELRDRAGSGKMTLRVTFDTNTFDKVVRPSVYPKDPKYPEFVAVHEALKRGDILGFISETIITLEGIGKDQRAPVFGTTDLRSRTEQVSEDTFAVTLTPEQTARQPVHPKQAERFVAAFDLGFRLLGAPRIGMPRVEGDFYVSEPPETLTERLDRYFNILQAIEARGLGSPRVMAIANRWADRAAPNEPWYRLLGTAKDIYETREVARAIAEWSDADSIGAHYGYANDLFCTLDVAAGEGRRGDAAVLDANNREWLSSNFGIKFGTLRDLATLVRNK